MPKPLKDLPPTSIGDISNYYGSLVLTVKAGQASWSITDWDGDNWNDIPDYLARALLRYNRECGQ
jgi:hypothetical protein